MVIGDIGSRFVSHMEGKTLTGMVRASQERTRGSFNGGGTGARHSPARRRRGWGLAGFAVVAACGLTVAFSLGFGSGDERAVRTMGDEFLTHFASGNIRAAAARFEEGAMGAPLIESERARLGLPANRPVGNSDAKAERRRQLERIRRELEADGVAWERVRPLAFGGAQAEVMAPDVMRRAAVALTGNIYFSSGGRVYLIEVSARRCGRHYILTELWQWKRLDGGHTDLQEHALEEYLAFKDENPAPREAAIVTQPQFIFTNL